MTKLFLTIILFISFWNNSFYRRVNTEINNARQKIYQYMAVCTDGDGALCSWVDTQDAANKYGKDHEVSTKGHRWRIDTREKPEAKKDSTNTYKQLFYEKDL